MDARLQLLNSVNQITKSYELYSPVTEPEKNESFKNSVRLSINPNANPFISPSILKSFNVNYVRSNLVSDENYERAVNLIETGSLLSSPESAYFIYNSLISNGNSSAEIITSPLSKGGFTLQINQTAQNHIVKGTSVAASSNSGIQNGTYVFNVRTAESNNLISVNVSNNEQYSSILNKIASSINSSDIGLTAAVNSDNFNSSNKHLVISADETGEDYNFVISDVIGELQSLFMPNADENIIQIGRDAVITLNNSEIKSPSNEIISEEYNILIKLKSQDSDTQNINLSKNTKYIGYIISSYLKNTSTFIEELKSSGDTHSKNTIDSIFNNLKPISGALQEIGVSIDFKKKTFSIDEKKLELSIDTNLSYLENTVSGHQGLTKILNKELSEYLRTPIDLFSLPSTNYESYSYIPAGYNIYNPYEIRNNSLRL
ncbi:hypothetical protein KA977_02105 [Candidatus Dependentiae bacterium]|nr:hypothetical protein [Candidatus Dependentiae bacterium]